MISQITIGSIKYAQDRVLYNGLWQDTSFLSLYLVTPIPLLFMRKAKYRWATALFFLASSVLTSARTGVAGLLLALIVAPFYGYRRHKLTVKNILHIFCVVLLCMVLSVIYLHLRGKHFIPALENANILAGIAYFSEAAIIWLSV